MTRPIVKASYSHLIALGVIYNLIQSILLFVFPSASMNWYATISFVIPILFVSYFAMRLDKIAYLLFLYWLLILSFSIQTNSVTLVWKFGFNLNIPVFEDKLAINPATIILLIIALFEMEKVFPVEESQSPLLLSDEKITSGSSEKDRVEDRI